MASRYYKPCKELEICDGLIEQYFQTGQYEKCFEGHMELAQQGYPLAECQVGYFYLNGLGVEKNEEQAFFWSKRSAEHGDWDAQYNLATFYERGVGTSPDMEKARHWYRQAALQQHKLAMERSKELGIDF